MTAPTPVSTRTAAVHRIPMAGPDDASGLAALLRSGTVSAPDIVAVLGKTEGNGGVNDFSRGFATQTVAQLIAAHRDCAVADVLAEVAFVMSGGTEGVLSPHMTIISVRASAQPAGGKRLAVGTAHTRPFLPEEVGRPVMITETAMATRAAMADAGIADPADVHFVQVKCPLVTTAQVAAARARGAHAITSDTYASMGHSRGASALGVAWALGELTGPPEDALGDPQRWSGVASTSAGIEVARNEVIVMGMADGWGGDLVIGHAVMADAIDAAAVRRALADAGLPTEGSLEEDQTARLINVFAKAEAAPSGTVRGWRHTMSTDTDLSSTRHARAAVGGVIASVVGHPMVYVSGGAEHQGPPGGGPVAAIARLT